MVSFTDTGVVHARNPTTTISYSLKSDCFVTLKVFDVLGREVANLVNLHQKAGEHQTTFDASGLPSGIYFYNIKADGNFSETRKMMLLK